MLWCLTSVAVLFVLLALAALTAHPLRMRLPPLLRVLLETAFEQLDKTWIEAWRQRAPVDIALQHRRENFRRGITLERPSSAEQLVENAAKREDVASLVGFEAFRLFGRHVARGAEDDARIGAGEAQGRRMREIR